MIPAYAYNADPQVDVTLIINGGCSKSLRNVIIPYTYIVPSRGNRIHIIPFNHYANPKSSVIYNITQK